MSSLLVASISAPMTRESIESFRQSLASSICKRSFVRARSRTRCFLPVYHAVRKSLRVVNAPQTTTPISPAQAASIYRTISRIIGLGGRGPTEGPRFLAMSLSGAKSFKDLQNSKRQKCHASHRLWGLLWGCHSEMMRSLCHCLVPRAS